MQHKKTLVGVPFYDGEGLEVLKTCLKNIDDCLKNLDIEAKILIGINGPRISMGQMPLEYLIDEKDYQTPIEFIKTQPGLVNSEKAIAKHALKMGYERIFLTDADISRLPHALAYMWDYGDRPIVGCNYSTYPIDLLKAAGINFSPTEIKLAQIFEADKDPLIRKYTSAYRPALRLKGSLLLVDAKIVQTMFGFQNITSDSRMNRTVPETDRQVIHEAAFMHFPRTNITDHIQARLRHFHAAHTENDLETFSRKSIFYSKTLANTIADKIKHEEGMNEALSNFLLQCALSIEVAKICKTIASGNTYEPARSVTPVNITDIKDIVTFQDAQENVSSIINAVNWSNLNSPVSTGSGTTNNEKTRTPLDLRPFLKFDQYKQLIHKHLDIADNTLL